MKCKKSAYIISKTILLKVDLALMNSIKIWKFASLTCSGN